ncbi:TetR/AcrR family transcriptional regulator [bacterium 210820-DFI.6.37]|nr:TetR/AcrR family transcriptional regulator [bacterium 210820-DFI.6.37]
MGRDTREKIMVTAIDLFNRKGVTNVSTVQLSNELHISPGNLYYYFDNKEHLIRNIWQEMLLPKLDSLFSEKKHRESEEGLMEFFLKLSQYTYDYKFFYLELPAVLNNDPAMKTIYKEWSIAMMRQIDGIFQEWSETGIMKPDLSPVARDLLVQNCWTLSQTGMTYVNMLDSEASSKEACDSIIQRLYALLHPYFSQESHEKMVRLFDANNLGFYNYT